MVVPSSVRRAAIAWAAAVTCGMIESALAVVQAASQRVPGPELLAQLGVRVVVYMLATVLIVYLWQGHRWARRALTVLLTVIGLASLLVPAVAALTAGQTFLQAFGGGGPLGWVFALVRLTHIACVLGASVLMFTSSANQYFAVSRRSAASSPVAANRD